MKDTAIKIKQRVFVLVEGKTDKRVLDFCLRNFYPELINHIEIVSFDNPNRAGGASFVADFMKTLLNASNSSETTKLYIALLDNDTEGVRNKDIFSDYPNAKVLTYPDIRAFKRYPTYSTRKGGNIVIDDINGRAASIELYLPDFMIKDAMGNFYPIRWQSYEQNVGKYQGHLEKSVKEKIINKFDTYCGEVKNGATVIIDEDWVKCKTIIDMVIKKLKSKKRSML